MVGTGASAYDAKTTAKWGIRKWLLYLLTHSSDNMVNFHISALLQALHYKNNYIRIQDDTLTEAETSVDLLTEVNMKKLVEIGKNLLKN